MADPTTVPQLNILFTEFRRGLEALLLEVRRGLEDHIGTLQTLVWTVLSAIGVLIVAVGGNYAHVYLVEKEIVAKIDDLKKDIAVLQTSIHPV